MMKCPKCGGKSKVVQTHALKETIMETSSIGGGDFEHPVQIVQVPVEHDLIRRKQHCLSCGCYFWTAERFDCYTEKTAKNSIMEEMRKKLDTLDEALANDEIVYAIPPRENNTKLRLNFQVVRKDKDHG